LAYLVPLGGLALALVYVPRTSAVLAAFVIATALERHRQSARRRPLRLVDSPRAWRATLNATVGVPAAIVVLALGVAAVALERAHFGLERTTTTTGQGGAGTAEGPAARLPRLAVRRYPPSLSFVLAGARFNVHPSPGALWAAQLRQRAAGRGQRWVTIAVETRNLRRRRFDPNTLAYRLRDRRGNVYHANVGGGTGPPSLSTPGLLRPGLSAESRLGFRVPRTIRRVELVFEPSIGGSVQARVPIEAPSADKLW
jgi:hypothetical protein